MMDATSMAVRQRLAMAAVCLFAWGCSSAGGCLEPLPARFPSAEKKDNAVLFRLASGGINFLNNDASRDRLIETFFPGGIINVPVNCFTTNVALVGTVLIANQGGAQSACGTNKANWDACGRMDKACDAKDAPVNVTVQINDMELVPQAPDTLVGRVELSINTPPIYVDTDGNDCLGFGVVECDVEFDTDRASGAGDLDYVRLGASIEFTIDTKWDKLVKFAVTQIDGVDICGENGSSQPDCIDTDDMAINSHACSAICTGADFLKGTILGLVSGPIRDNIEKTVGKQSCEPCGSGKPACPNFAGATSCVDDICVESANTDRCVPRFLGIEGRVSPATLLGGYGVPASSQLDLSVAAGSSVSVDTGLNVGTRMGIKATTPATCVPLLPAPTPRLVGAPNLDAEASQKAKDAGYHAALGISQHFLESAAYEAHQSGVLCLGVTTSTFAIVNTGLFKTLLPSLGKLATRDGKDAPMMVVLRPNAAPQIRVGEGTYDAVTKKPIDPLVTLTLPQLQIDFYAMLDDRYARLFSLSADVRLPLSLIIEGCSSLTPALGDLKQLISNVKTADSEMLAEDPAVLADLIPAVIGLAEPALAGIIKPVALPSLNGFKLQLSDVRGIGQTGSEFSHLGLYASIKFEEQTCATGAPITQASLLRTDIPAREAMRLTGRGLKTASAVLDVRALGTDGTPEFATRINGGLWSDFSPASPAGTLTIAHPTFAFEGHHVIEVRSRTQEQPAGISAPVSVGVRLDWTAPSVKLSADPQTNRLLVTASDNLTAEGELEYAYRLGAEAFSGFGPAREVDLSAIESAGGFSVQVRDAAGNVGEAHWRMPTVADRPDAEGSSTGVASAVGCSSAGGGLSLLALFGTLSLALRRRRS